MATSRAGCRAHRETTARQLHVCSDGETFDPTLRELHGVMAEVAFAARSNHARDDESAALFRNSWLRLTELAEEPGLCRFEVPVDGLRRDVQHIRCLFDAEAAKEPQLDDLAHTGVEQRQGAKCITESDKVALLRLRLLDFGVAKMKLRDESTRSGEWILEPGTAIGRVIGSGPCMSPEQITGGDVDPRSDVFSLGVVIYQMATGQLSFSGSTREAISYVRLSRT